MEKGSFIIILIIMVVIGLVWGGLTFFNKPTPEVAPSSLDELLAPINSEFDPALVARISKLPSLQSNLNNADIKIGAIISTESSQSAAVTPITSTPRPSPTTQPQSTNSPVLRSPVATSSATP